MKDEFFKYEEHEGFWMMKNPPLYFDVAQHGAFYGGGWFGFEGICARLLARTGMNPRAIFTKSAKADSIEAPNLDMLYLRLFARHRCNWIGKKHYVKKRNSR